ncbi:MAG: hypothetical protein ACW98D_18455 [Promethearchaeota archaeon]
MNKIFASILIFSALSFRIIAQSSSEQQFDFAKKLYDEEKYFDAVTELKRLLFFNNDEQYKYEANNLIGLSYKQGAKFSDAIHHFTRAELNAETEQEIYQSRIEIIRINILRRTTSRVLVLIDSLESDERFNTNYDELNYWRGWAYIFADDWEKVATSFSKIDTNHELKRLAEEVDDEHYSVTFAKTISYFIPGAGQFYTGEYISGLLSLGWNVLWGYLTITSFIDDRIFDGIMVGTLLWYRFYRGNFQNAEKFAIEKNLNISNKALYYLQNEYNGLKP